MYTNRNQNRNQRRRAFTLLEIMLALAILALLSGALFTLVQGSLEATAVLTQKENRDAQVYGFLQLCNETFRQLPPQAIIQSGVVGEDGFNLPVIVILDAPQAFVWSDTKIHNRNVYLSARPQLGGALSLCLQRPESYRQDRSSAFEAVKNLPSNEWLALLKDLLKINWRFFDPRTGDWTAEWHNATMRPGAIELTIVPMPENEPIRAIIWLPPVQHVEFARF